MPKASAFLLAAAVLLAGCSGGPDAQLPGVFTQSQVSDDFRCGETLFAAGCVIVRVPEVVSGCVPEVPGYVVCNATLSWSASSGAVMPGSRLVATVNGTDAGSCMLGPGATCRLDGFANFTHSFEGPGESYQWTLVISARLEVPAGAPATSGEFTLSVTFNVRAQDEDAIDV